MKKFIAVLLSVIVLLTCFAMPSSAEEYPIKRENLQVRDPFVLAYEGKYYMYGTCLSQGEGYGCVVSEDLENWSEKIQIFSPDENFDGYADFWAPECHYYKGAFYLFATYRSRSGEKEARLFLNPILLQVRLSRFLTVMLLRKTRTALTVRSTLTKTVSLGWFS